MSMLKSHSHTYQISSISLPIPIQIKKPKTKPLFHFTQIQTSSFSHGQLKSRTKYLKGFKVSSVEESNGNNGGSGGDEVSKIKLNWSELLLDLNGDNVVAVALSGALAWASAYVLWHMFVVTMSVLMAAIKYTIVGGVLIFILITLL